MDVWQYIAREEIDLPSIYFAHRREVFRRDGMLLAVTRFVTLLPDEELENLSVRFRTVGDATCTGAVESPAATAEEIIVEVAASRITERGATRGRRQVQRGGDGGPQEGGLLLMEMLRFATAGSVDDGKSTLIGRLLLDSKQIFEDQLESVERTSREKGFDYTNLALLTDGLRAEREQGITIDVAYRYFATPRRKFIIADTPGHVQYTRNMVTGASTADLALILVDARHGVVEQSRRHSVIASLLSVRHLVLCVNKMDLVDYDQLRVRPDLGGVPGVGGQARHHRPHVHPRLGAPRRQRHRAQREHDVVRRADAAPPPRAPLHRLGPQPHRRPDAGAVRHPADERQAPRLPRLRGPGRGRDVPARRRGAGAAVRAHHADRAGSTSTARSSPRPCRRCR